MLLRHFCFIYLLIFLVGCTESGKSFSNDNNKYFAIKDCTKLYDLYVGDYLTVDSAMDSQYIVEGFDEIKYITPDSNYVYILSGGHPFGRTMQPKNIYVGKIDRDGNLLYEFRTREANTYH